MSNIKCSCLKDKTRVCLRVVGEEEYVCYSSLEHESSPSSVIDQP